MIKNQVAIASVPMMHDTTIVKQRNTILTPLKGKAI
jgi:hypothetical protein